VQCGLKQFSLLQFRAVESGLARFRTVIRRSELL
jgi:hypothetical protein